jgi:diguanylate cyclase (GGDEF)-like protein
MVLRGDLSPLSLGSPYKIIEQHKIGFPFSGVQIILKMPTPTSALLSSGPNQALLNTLALIKRISLVGVSLIAFLSLAVWLIVPLARAFPAGWQFMNADAAFCVLLGALSLDFSEPGLSKRMHRLSLVFAALVTLLAAAVLVEYHFHIPLGIDTLTVVGPGVRASLLPRMSPQAAIGFELAGISTILLRVRHRYASPLADILIFLLSGLALILASEYLFSILPLFGLSNSFHTAPLTLFCLIFLALAAFLRHAEKGFFSILLGRGIGSRIARLFSPLMLLLPFLREITRVHFINAHHLPANYATATLASIMGMLALALLLFIAWRITGMEKEIQNLSLRDELTGLYNLRGFQVLAEQALRLARRSQVPFSVLFIDLDNLKQINDLHGHSVGSSAITETGQLLRDTFRESDVLARIGGDEFAVAGQFSHDSTAVATERLRETLAQRNQQPGQSATLSFSVGHVTSDVGDQDSLRELLARADGAMYEEKRRKKLEIA